MLLLISMIYQMLQNTETLCLSPYSVRMRENADQKNS